MKSWAYGIFRHPKPRTLETSTKQITCSGLANGRFGLLYSGIPAEPVAVGFKFPATEIRVPTHRFVVILFQYEHSFYWASCACLYTD